MFNYTNIYLSKYIMYVVCTMYLRRMYAIKIIRYLLHYVYGMVYMLFHAPLL